MTKLKNQSYYGSQAYRVDSIPAQKPCVRKNSFMSDSVRLPWGDTQQVIPTRIMEEINPKNMKFREQTEKKKLEDSTNKKMPPRTTRISSFTPHMIMKDLNFHNCHLLLNYGFTFYN